MVSDGSTSSVMVLPVEEGRRIYTRDASQHMDHGQGQGRQVGGGDERRHDGDGLEVIVEQTPTKVVNMCGWV
jgi:hypothetical protein